MMDSEETTVAPQRIGERKASKGLIIGTYEGATVKIRKFLLDRFFVSGKQQLAIFAVGGCSCVPHHALVVT